MFASKNKARENMLLQQQAILRNNCLLILITLDTAIALANKPEPGCEIYTNLNKHSHSAV